MKTRKLRNIEVSEIGYRCMGFSHGYGALCMYFCGILSNTATAAVSTNRYILIFKSFVFKAFGRFY